MTWILVSGSLFVLNVQSLVARHAWRNELSSSELSVLTQPARVVASSMLDWLHGRALKRGRRLMERSDEERHELRIALKDLRYGVEFFSSLFGHSRRVRALLKAVSQLQDLLGSHNDTVSTERLAIRLSDGLGPDAARAAGYFIGWHACAIPLADAKLEQVWKAFKKLRPFWH